MRLLFVVLLLLRCEARSHIIQSTESLEHEKTEKDQNSNFIPKEDVFKVNENDTNVKKTSEKWDCSKDDAENNQGLMVTTAMIKKAEKELSQQNSRTDNTILVLGNAGAGKTTFVQFMAGDNNKLISKEADSRLGHYLIEDGVKIGNSVTESFTLYPEQLSIDSETSFTDTPGFSDTRSETHEIVATHIMKKYLQSIKKIKIVLLVTYNSLEPGMYKNDFIDLLQNVNDFIKDIDKYNDCIALVATKVPNMFKVTKSDVTAVSDESVIESVANYLNQTKISLKEKLKNSNIFRKIKFLENAIKIIDCLLKADEDGKYKRINIFRQPSEQGALSTMSSLQEEKKSIQNTIFNNINYSIISSNNVGYSLSHKAKNYLHCLLWYINDNVGRISSYVFQLIDNHYQSKIKQTADIYVLRPTLETTIKKLKSFKSNLKGSLTYNNYSSIIRDFITSENVQNISVDNDTFYNVGHYINSLEEFTNTGSILSTVEWAEQMKPLLNNVKESLSWCNFQIKLFELLSSYEIQKTKASYLNMTSLSNLSFGEYVLLSNFDKLLLKDDDMYRYLLTLDVERSREINDLVSLTLVKQNNISCDDEGKLMVIGQFIKLSEINSSDVVKQYCRNEQVKVISIYAIHTIFIDGDLTDEYFRGKDVMIAAPRWEIIGKRIIDINGIPGKNHSNPKAQDGNDLSENGADGMPGFPGGNGGNFIGFGLHFINDDNLIIEANGGNGGSGQDGGNGKDGKKGTEGYEKFDTNPPSDHSYDEVWVNGSKSTPATSWFQKTPEESKMESYYCSANIKLYKKTGECGTIGGNGGNGGVNGLGGNAGKVLILGGEKPPKFTIHNSKGSLGSPGKNGRGGKTGESGKSVECFKINVHQDYHSCQGYYFNGTYIHPSCGTGNSFFWKCRYLEEKIVCSEISSAPGLSNYTSLGMLEPNKTIEYDFSEDLYNYTLVLKENESNKFLLNYVRKLQNEIYRQISLMKNKFWRFILLSVNPSTSATM